MEYLWPSSVNVANFVTVRPQLWDEARSMSFDMWKEQMVCLVESQDVAGFINGEMVEPQQSDEQKLWRRSDRLVKGWILGSIGTDVLQKVCKLQTAREVWLELEKIFFNDEVTNVIEPDSSESNRDLSRYLPLYKAALEGDWETANTSFFQQNISETEAIITVYNETALHVAVKSGRANEFVLKLVGLMRREALALRNSSGYTALHCAAMFGNTDAAEVMVDKYPGLLDMLSNEGDLAVTVAAISYQKYTLMYLLAMSRIHMRNFHFEGQLGTHLLISVISSEFIDIALGLVDGYPDLARLGVGMENRCALLIMAGMESVFQSRQSFTWWERLVYRCVPPKQYDWLISGYIVRRLKGGLRRTQFVDMIWKVLEFIVPRVKDIKEKKTTHTQAVRLVKVLCSEMNDSWIMLRDSMFMAAEHGISEIIEVIIDMYPMMMDMYPVVTVSEDKNTRGHIMHLAASNRFENVFNLTYNMSDREPLISNFVDEDGNNLMHICGKLAPPDRLNQVPGAALQMQRELQWFNEMKKFVHPSRRKRVNNKGKTPKMLFTEEHKELKAEGENWMKGTANAFSIAAALITTVVFAAAFTVPGGVSSETGIPVFFNKSAFVLFSTTNAISLFTSITSLLLFLSILTSRYAEGDFLHILPKRLSFGLLSLFVSITFMLVAFSAAIYLVFQTKRAWFLIPVAAFAWLPVTSFVLLQFPLLVDVFYSTYGHGIFGKKSNLPQKKHGRRRCGSSIDSCINLCC